MKDIIESIKNNFFVVLVAIVLLIGASVYIIDANKENVSSKSVDGKNVVVSIGDYNLTSDELYDLGYKQLAPNSYANFFQNEVIEQSIATNNEIKETAKNTANNIKQSFIAQFGQDKYEAQLTQQLAQIGYKNLDEYTIHTAKAELLVNAYIEKDKTKYIDPVMKDNNPRMVSHIIVKMVDANNPTEEESAKVAKIDAALKAGTDFATIAKENSDDSSAAIGGIIGYVDNKSTNLQADFLKSSLSLKKDEVSEWVKVSDDSYNGWHRIKVTETDGTTLLKDPAFKAGLYNRILESNSGLYAQILWEKSKELDIKFANDEIKKEVTTAFGIKE
ncbi:MAG: peptidylprolyl isomerase [Erysipelotrichaceae bacterium]